jgi:hypothetical protein
MEGGDAAAKAVPATTLSRQNLTRDDGPMEPDFAPPELVRVALTESESFTVSPAMRNDENTPERETESRPVRQCGIRGGHPL